MDCVLAFSRLTLAILGQENCFYRPQLSLQCTGGGKRWAGICGLFSSQEKTATTEPSAGPDLLRSSSKPDRCRTYSSRSFFQLLDFVVGMRKCRRYIRQVCASRVILDPYLSAYRKEISRHSTRVSLITFNHLTAIGRQFSVRST